MSNQAKVDRIHERLAKVNEVSPTMCLAKWLQSTVQLQNGFTHSCHHPAPHKIPLDEIKASPKALHNTKHKLAARRELLAGVQTKECDYCWNIENLSESHISDRAYKSANAWAFNNFDKVIESGDGAEISPTYLEVSFDNTCNFKCVYCSPAISSKWMEEIEHFGPFPTSRQHNNLEWLKQTDRMPIPQREDNPYVNAFWEWWPELRKNLHTFRITGGEPLLSKHTWRILDDLIENPQPHLSIAINSNMCVPDQLQTKLIEYANKLKGKIKQFDLFTSIEAGDGASEYIRYGMNAPEFWDNVWDFLEQTPWRVHIMTTMNVLCVPSFHHMLNHIADLRDEFNETREFNRITMMINYLRWPEFLDLRILDDANKKEFASNMEVWTTPGRPLYMEECDQIKRMIDFMNEPVDNLGQRRKDFAKFIREIDKRRDTKFEDQFWQLESFLYDCEIYA